jgi:hypothetical protein
MPLYQQSDLLDSGGFELKCGVSLKSKVMLDRRVLDLAPLFSANIEKIVSE